MWLITTRSQVRVLPPLPKKVPDLVSGIFLGTEADSVLRQRFSDGKYRSRRFGVVRTRAEASFEHAAAEKDEVRCPAPPHLIPALSVLFTSC